MAGGEGEDNTSSRKRPRTQSVSAGGRRPPLGNRPSNGRLSQIRADIDSVADVPEANLRTFTDLIGGGRSRAEQFLGDEAQDDIWASFGNTLDNMGSLSNLPTVIQNDNASRVVYDEDSRAFSEELARDESISGEKFEKTPLDLTLKRKVDIVSKSSMRWALRRGQGEEYNALVQLTGGETGAWGDRGGENVSVRVEDRFEYNSNCLNSRATGNEDLLRSKNCFYKALLHFRCPGESLPKAISSRWQVLASNYGRASWQEHALHDDKRFVVNRLIRWQSAVQSLYFGYRHGHIPDFYVILPTTTIFFNKGNLLAGSKNRKRSTSLDSTAKIKESSCFRASLAKASTGLRALMSEHEVPFTLVERTSGFADPGVVVEGDFAVQALFNFLLSQGPIISNSDDVPLLLSDRPFRGCTIFSADVLNAKQMLIPGKSGKQPEHRHTMQLSGLFTSRQIHYICESLAKIQEGGFVARFETEETGAMLNTFGHGDDPPEGDDAEDERFKLRGPIVLSRIQNDSTGHGFAVTTREAK